jgi:hypothetical protein
MTASQLPAIHRSFPPCRGNDLENTGFTVAPLSAEVAAIPLQPKRPPSYEPKPALGSVNETDQGTALGRCAPPFGTGEVWVCADEIADTAKLGGQQLWSLEFSRVNLPEALRKL